MSEEIEFTAAGQRIWKKYDDGYIVRSMTLEDASVVHNWYNDTMGDISKYDVNIMLSCYPLNSPGFYIGEYEGEIVASAVRVPWGDNIVYGSFYYVAKPHRLRGFGTRLLDQFDKLRDDVGVEHLGKRILCVDACTGKVSTDNLEKFNYTMGYECFRYGGVARDNYDDVTNASANDNSPTILKASEVDFDKLMSFDNDCFVSRDFPVRREFIRKWIWTREGASYAAINSSGHVVGYGSIHPAINAGQHILGPLYSSSPDTAERILARLCKDVAGQNINMTISSQNSSAMEIVKRFGLKEAFSLNRMHLNGDPQEHKDSVIAFTSLDVCGF